MHGSTAFGLAGPDSDLDLKGILVGPPAWYYGYQGGPQQVALNADHMQFELRKFFALAAKANPTALEMLYVDPVHHRQVHPVARALLDQRQLFLTQQVAETFGKYAISQLKRIKGHRAWLTDPPKGPPSPADFAHEHERKAAQKRWKQYRNWVDNRNPARAALEATHGYDTKHGMHLIRLLRMGIEALQTGTLTVTRPDREELLSIKSGAWSYEALVAYAEAQQTQIAVAATSSGLPAQVNTEAANALCARLVRQVLTGR